MDAAVRRTDLGLEGLALLEPRVFRDDRGFFSESWNRRAFEAMLGADVAFVQDNHSRSTRRVLRGLHYQLPPHPQGKLVRVVRGKVWDVAVDIRRSSATFGQWAAVELHEDEPRQLWIPPGFAHGFLVISDVADVLYKTTAYYDRELDRCIRWDDPELAVEWPLGGRQPVLSTKDAEAAYLADSAVFD